MTRGTQKDNTTRVANLGAIGSFPLRKRRLMVEVQIRAGQEAVLLTVAEVRTLWPVRKPCATHGANAELDQPTDDPRTEVGRPVEGIPTLMGGATTLLDRPLMLSTVPAYDEIRAPSRGTEAGCRNRHGYNRSIPITTNTSTMPVNANSFP